MFLADSSWILPLPHCAHPPVLPEDLLPGEQPPACSFSVAPLLSSHISGIWGDEHDMRWNPPVPSFCAVFHELAGRSLQHTTCC